MSRHSGGGSLTNTRRRKTLRKRGSNSIRKTKSHSPYTNLKRKTLKHVSNIKVPKKNSDKERRIAKLKKKLAELEGERNEYSAIEKRLDAQIAEAKAKDEAEKARKAKLKPIKAPKLIYVKDKMPLNDFNYLKKVLRSISSGESHVGGTGKDKYIYYKRDEVVKNLTKQMGLISKFKKALGYDFPDEERRKAVLVQLNRYIKYFEYNADKQELKDKYINELFDGLRD